MVNGRRLLFSIGTPDFMTRFQRAHSSTAATIAATRSNELIMPTG